MIMDVGSLRRGERVWDAGEISGGIERELRRGADAAPHGSAPNTESREAERDAVRWLRSALTESGRDRRASGIKGTMPAKLRIAGLRSETRIGHALLRT